MTSLIQSTRRVDLSKIPDQAHKVFLVTGGNVGIGFETARALAARNGRVFIASRNPERCQSAVQRIKQEFPGAQIEFLQLDNCDLRSVHRCSEDFKQKGLPLDCLLNNIGVENPPDGLTADGFDPTLASNYAGHWYLTHLLLDQLKAAPHARVVNVSSLTELHGEPEWTDIMGSRAARSDYLQYCNSKVFLLMFTAELQKRLRAADSSIDVFAAHPGVALTDAYRKSDKSKPIAASMAFGAQLIGQSAGGGAQPLLKCATLPSLTGHGGAELHHGPWYSGLSIKPFGQAWPLAFTANWDNFGARRPISKWVSNAEACSKLYQETARIINDKAPVPVQTL